MSDGSDFWRRVRERMADQEIDLAELARRTRINYHTLNSQMERGSAPKLAMAKAVARATFTSLHWLETETGGKEPVMAPSAEALSDLLADMPEHRARILLEVAETWTPEPEQSPQAAPVVRAEVAEKEP